MWNYDNVIPRAQLEAEARASGQEIAIGKLMTIMSWKNAESEELKLKARIVFRGDNVRTAEGVRPIPRNQSVSNYNSWN